MPFGFGSDPLPMLVASTLGRDNAQQAFRDIPRCTTETPELKPAASVLNIFAQGTGSGRGMMHRRPLRGLTTIRLPLESRRGAEGHGVPVSSSEPRRSGPICCCSPPPLRESIPEARRVTTWMLRALSKAL